MRRLLSPFVLLLAGASLIGCNSTTVVRGDGDALALIRALPENARPRIAVLPVLDHTPKYGVRSLDLNMVLVNLYRPEAEQTSKLQFTGAIRDMLVTDLFSSKAFIVLDRDTLPAVLAEQAFADSARFDPASVVKAGALEGAQFLVAAAVTAFDTGSEGGALPIPIPGVINSNMSALGVLNLGYKRGYVSLDVRVIDAKTGRVVHTGAVEGKNTKYGLDLAAIAAVRAVGVTQVPDVIKFFKNTPVEEALQKMSIAAVLDIAKAFQPVVVTKP